MTIARSGGGRTSAAKSTSSTTRWRVGKGLDHWADVLRKKAAEGGFQYQCHLLPHDIEAREISSAKSRRADARRTDPEGRADHHRAAHPLERRRHPRRPRHARLGLLRRGNCKTGLAMLRGYHKSAMGQPVHGPGPHSHGADAFQTAAVGFHLVSGLSASHAQARPDAAQDQGHRVSDVREPRTMALVRQARCDPRVIRSTRASGSSTKSTPGRHRPDYVEALARARAAFGMTGPTKSG